MALVHPNTYNTFVPLNIKERVAFLQSKASSYILCELRCLVDYIFISARSSLMMFSVIWAVVNFLIDFATLH